MPQNPNYIPAKDSLAGPWSDNFNTLLTAAPTDYGLVAGDAVAAAAVITPWLAALATSSTPVTRTSVTIAAKDDARAAMEAVVRPLAVAISQNPAISNELKTGIGVTPRITTKTRNSVVANNAAISPYFDSLGNIVFNGYDPDTPDSVARPLGALGWELQVRTKETLASDWVTILDLTVTRPLWKWDHEGVIAADAACRVRWVGALLVGGGLNVGPWSAWFDLDIPAT